MSNFITELKPNEIFVFGANKDGYHAGGAAKFAQDKRWTRHGHSEGLLWQSYAIDTMSGFETIDLGLKGLIITARCNPALTFLLTPIGQGIAGYKPEEIQGIIDRIGGLPDNVKKVGW